MASINDIVLQYTEMRQGLKQLRLELETYWPSPEEIKMLEQQKTIQEKIKNVAEGDSNIAQNEKNDNGSTGNDDVEEGKNEDTETADLQGEEAGEDEAIDVSNAFSDDHEVNEATAEKYDDGSSEAAQDLEKGDEDYVKDTDNVEEKKNLEGSNNGEAAAEDEVSEIVSLDRFMQVMQEYRNSANDRFEELEALYVNVDVKWRDIMIYYGESPKLTRPDEFFNIFSRFISSWKQATAEELKYSERLEREERRRQELEEKRRALLRSSTGDETSDSDGASTATTTGGEEEDDNDRRVMDNLMEQLRSGKAENRMRQRRVRERLKRLKQNEEEEQQQLMKRQIADRRKATRLSVVTTRRDSVSSTTSSQMPVISAEDLLRSLQQEED